MKPHFAGSMNNSLWEPWMVLPAVYFSLVQRAAALDLDTLKEFSSFGGNGDDDDDCLKYEMIGQSGVARLNIHGPIARNQESWEKKYYGVMSQSDIDCALQKMGADPSVRAVLLSIDSPGGHATGTPELSDAVAALESKKPVVSHTGGVMGSAAYYIGAQATMVMATRSSYVGSIGTIMSWLDISGYYEQLGVKRETIVNDGAIYKGAGLPGTSLTKEQRAQLQELVNQSGTMFKDAVRAKRGCGDDAMRGQCFMGEGALTAKLIDQVGSLEMAARAAAKLADMRGVRG